ncbi:hypothetical protein N3K66_007108 [Trichothecium roseum]|uniref:Uncharacterized protein n=1 Tax=Trichothecium roseum TaxID=47278 RepID=A0ACC0UXX5_9HYPO|nr:hypothetical protein N3K66_007108 [Trichothecium roseum]
MVPYPAQPPMAQHLNLPRPTSAASLARQSVEYPDGDGRIKRPGSTSFLHSQIRTLQKQLEARSEEAAQLRRQLEAQEDSDVGTLSEQLREAKRETQMWKDRAESAERRVKVFERFTARLKGIRAAAAAAANETENSNDELGSRRLSDDSDRMRDSGDAADQPPIDKQQARFVKGRGTTEDTAKSDGSGHTEDAGTVTARIRKCLHGNGGQEAGGTSDGALDDRLGEPLLLRDRSKSSSRDISMGAMEIWMAAQELLDDSQV